MPRLNPLLPPILRHLREQPAGCSEYQLIRRLEADGAFPELAEPAQLALFQRHFLVMNALYQLQERLWREERLYLDISPLRICLEAPPPGAAATGLPAGDAGLRAYYLDWAQFDETGAEAVDALLAGFWQRLLAPDAIQRAFEVLELPADAGADRIRGHYRRLAGRHHPDRGGSSEDFLAVREAYEVLCRAGICK